MKAKKTYVSKSDYNRLKDFIKNKGPVYVRHDVEKLDSVLKNAVIVNPENIHSDVVTMNSRIRIRDIELDEEYVYTIAYPDRSYTSDDSCSILTPVGTALLGCRVGDKVKCNIAHGHITIRIEEIIYQPEAAGDFHL